MPHPPGSQGTCTVGYCWSDLVYIYITLILSLPPLNIPVFFPLPLSSLLPFLLQYPLLSSNSREELMRKYRSANRSSSKRRQDPYADAVVLARRLYMLDGYKKSEVAQQLADMCVPPASLYLAMLCTSIWLALSV